MRFAILGRGILQHTQSGYRSAQYRSSLAIGVAFSAFLAGMGAPLNAQEQVDAQELEAPSSRVPVIVVTATKREQTLQETPVAVSVVGAEEIERAEIQDLADLQTLVPSLAVRQEQTSGATNFFIRGFGNGSNAVGLEPSVGVFIDGVYRSRSTAAISDLPNLERVEVLRGPQSTLFGKNASAGVISVTTRKPQFEPEAMIETTRGNFNAFRLEGLVTGPITDTLAVSLAGNLNRRDGYADDPATGAEYNERDRWGVRGDILFEPSPDVSFRLIADYDEIDEDCCIITNVVEGPTGPIVRALGGQFTSEDPFAYEAFYDIVPTSRIENSGVSLQGDIGFGFANLTSITAYRNNESTSQFDPDATSLALFEANSQDTQIETFTQEIRLSSVGAGNRIDWMIGGFYFDEAIEADNSLFYGTDYRSFINALVGNPNALSQLEAFARVPLNSLAQPGQGTVDTITQDNTAWSIFGTVDFHVTDRLTATFGINYTEDEKDVAIDIISTDALAMLNLDQLGYNAALGTILAQSGVNILDPMSVLPFIQANPAQYAQIQQQALAGALGPANPFNQLRALQLFPGFVNIPNSVEDGQTRDDSTDFTFRLAYDLTDRVNVYASYATGFKASSWNLSRQSRPFSSDFAPGNPVADPVTMQLLQATPSSPITDAGLNFINLNSGTRFAGPEDAEVIELGVKGQFDTFAFNVAIFDQTIKGFQTNIFIEDGFVLANAEEQSTFGVEFDLTWSPVPQLVLRAAGTFLDANYDSFTNFGPGIDVSGQTPQGVADTQFSLGANYDFSIGSVNGFLRADWQHIGDSRFFDNPADEALIRTSDFTREQNLVNVSLGISPFNRTQLTLWARNVFEDEFPLGAAPAAAQAGSLNGVPSQPRTFGVTIRRSF